jgi:Major Facilitator Superfamily
MTMTPTTRSEQLRARPPATLPDGGPDRLAAPAPDGGPDGLVAPAPGIVPAPALAGNRRHRLGFWLVAYAFTVTMAFSAVPTPLYVLYQARDGFGPFTLTVIFAVYAAGVALSLLLAGHVSDWFGRRRVLVPAILVNVLAGVIFLAWPAVPGLLIARFVSGISIGMLTATATAHLTELHLTARPGASRSRADVVATAANLGGIGLGPLVSGLLAQYAPDPLHLPFYVVEGLMLVGVLFLALVPETVDQPEPRPAGRAARVPGRRRRGRRGVRDVRPVHLAGPEFPGRDPARHLARAGRAGRLPGLRRLGREPDPARPLAAAPPVPAGIRGARAGHRGRHRRDLGHQPAAAADRRRARRRRGGGVFKGSVSTVINIAPAHTRGEALAGLFLASYIGLAVPVVGLGIATQYLPARVALLIFSAALLAGLATVARQLLRHSAA